MLPSVNANIRLLGEVSDQMVSFFQGQMIDACGSDGSVVVEICTTGGDAESGRRLACEVALARKYYAKEMFFLGKTTVYSAGVTFMAEFPVTHRYLTEDAMLLVHERRTKKKLNLDTPTSASIQVVEELLAQLKTGRMLEMEGFKKLAAGSRMSAEEVADRAKTEWYVPAREALELGLIAGIA